MNIGRISVSPWEQTVHPSWQTYTCFIMSTRSYMRSLLKTNLCLAKRFADTVRYIDDLLTLNNNKFNSEMSNIYPPELTLKRTTESDTKLYYLDVSISICHGKFVTEVYDKKDNYNFNIANYPFMCSNNYTSKAYIRCVYFTAY